MLILSRIIVKEWFKSLIGAVFVLFLLITTADLINGFLQGKDFIQVLLEYGLKMPDLMGKMFPICCLVASLFSLNRLKAHSELVSVLAAGYSYTRIYFLIGLCALSVVGMQFLNLGYLEPFANKIKRQEIQKSQRSEGRYLTRSSLEGGKFWYKSHGYFASFSFFDRRQKLLKDFEIYYFSEAHLSTKIIKSQSATFTSNNTWKLTGVTELNNLKNSTFPTENKRPELELALNELPEDFGEFEADITTLGFFSLNQFVNRLSKTGINISEYQIILFNKLFLSFICLVFALVPVSTIFNPNRRSSSFGKNVIFTLLITIAFWVLYSSTIALGNSGSLPPILATSLVPMLFFGFVVWTFQKNRKLA